MSKLLHKIWPKIIAFFLTLVLGLGLCGGILGIWYLAENRAYLDGGASMRKSLWDSICHNEATQAYYFLNTQFSQWGGNPSGDNNETAEKIQAAFAKEFPREKVNCQLLVTDATTGIEYCNFSLPENELLHTATYAFYTTAETAVSENDSYLVEQENGNFYVADAYPLTVTVMLPKDFQSDSYQTLLLNKLLDFRVGIIVVTVLCGLGCLFCFGFLMASLGHWPREEGIHLTWFDRIPWDVLALLPLVAFAAVDDWRYQVGNWVAPALIVMVLSPVLFLWLCTFVTRCKAGTVFKSCLIGWVCKIFWKFLRWLFGTLTMAGVVWKTAICAAALLLLDLICLVNHYDTEFLVLLFGVNILACCMAVHIAWGLRKLEKGAERLAEGDYAQPIALKGLHSGIRRSAEQLNEVQNGLEKAVAQQMKSERMKTELITNVSHDIKTPLTSIVNYVDLLEKENLPGEKVQEYLAVLDRQSKRLKKLTEDLVELSKASSGTMTVNRQSVDVNVLISQVGGEYQERLEKAGLTLVVMPTGGETRILADPVLLSRVADNLMTNVCKYAMPGTRVYVSLVSGGGKVTISVKNVSREELNITAEELQERFVRGDNSRTSEGSGLGLSIARSLVQLQGGQFAITIDGDLFRADIIFPAE